MKYKRVLITGGAGFIGKHLSTKLLSCGYDVTILDCLNSQVHADNPEFNNTENHSINFIRGTVNKKTDWMRALDSIDVVVHLAAETGTGQSMYNIEHYNNVNIQGTSVLLDILANNSHNVKKVVLASSRAIYGEGKYYCEEHGEVFPDSRLEKDLKNSFFECRCPICGNQVTLKPTCEMSKIHPTSVYGISKQVQEQLIMLMGQTLEIPSVSLRYQNVYGPGQSLSNPYTGILSIFSTRIKNNNDIHIFEDGNESRDFVYIDDVVRATFLCIESDQANYKCYNVGSGQKTSVLTVARELKELYESDIEIKITSKFRLGDIRHNYADIEKIKKDVGYTPIVDFSKGIKNFTSWVNRQKISRDNYDESINELKKKSLYK